MPIAKESGGDFIPAPPGTHIARCIGCVSLGTQPANNPGFNPTFKILLNFELPNELTEGGKPMTVSKEYTCSLSEKANLRRDLEGWRGRTFTREELDGFQVESVVGHPCMITIIHKRSGKGKEYAAISAISKLLKGGTAPEQIHPTVIYELEHGKNKVFQELPEWIQKKITGSAEWNDPPPVHTPTETPTDKAPEDDDVPF